MKRYDKNGAIDALFLVALLLIVIGAVFAFWRVNEADKVVQETHLATEAIDVNETPNASISGEASYPSEQLPSDFSVCARSTTKSNVNDICTSDFTNSSYELLLAADSYIVYAVSRTHEYVAHYNQCSLTGEATDCPTENPQTDIVIKLAANEKLENITPTSAYGYDDYDYFINASDFVISEWGIKLRLRNAEKLEYSYKAGGDFLATVQNTYDSSIVPKFELEYLDSKECVQPGIGVYRSKEVNNGSQSSNIKKLGDHYYFITGAPGQCSSGSASDLKLQSTFLEDFKTSNISELN